MKPIRITEWMLGAAAYCMLPVILMAQEQKKHLPLKDSLEGAFDLSDYIIDAHGFVPIPIIITDRALGGFGGGVVPVFVRPGPPYLDSVKGKLIRTPVFPREAGATISCLAAIGKNERRHLDLKFVTES